MRDFHCPDCELPMHLVRAEEVEVQRCDGCGGAWVQERALRARSSAWKVSRLGELSERRCPACRAQMDAVQTPSGVNLEACAHCEGVYFDPGELREVLEARRAASQASATFTCAKCGGQFPYREGNAVGGKLACRGCTPQVQLSVAERRLANHEEIRLRDVHSLMDLIDYLLQPRETTRYEKL